LIKAERKAIRPLIQIKLSGGQFPHPDFLFSNNSLELIFGALEGLGDIVGIAVGKFCSVFSIKLDGQFDGCWVGRTKGTVVGALNGMFVRYSNHHLHHHPIILMI
jgi:hypothetical protein